MTKLEEAIERIWVAARSTGKLRDDFRPAIEALVTLVKAEGREEAAKVCEETELLWDIRAWNNMTWPNVSAPSGPRRKGSTNDYGTTATVV